MGKVQLPRFVARIHARWLFVPQQRCFIVRMSLRSINAALAGRLCVVALAIMHD